MVGRSLENEYINDEELYSFIKSWKKITSDEKFDEDVKKCVKGLIEYPDLKAEDCAKKVYGTPAELGIRIAEDENGIFLDNIYLSCANPNYYQESLR